MMKSRIKLTIQIGDAIIFSDFRHGMFTKSSISTLSSKLPKDVLKVADSQVASRWGNITDFQGFDLITPNEREARFSLADQDSNIAKLAFELKEATNCSNVIMKLGKRGAFFVNSNTYNSVDSFATDIKDAVGAGDALFYLLNSNDVKLEIFNSINYIRVDSSSN